MRRQKEPIMQCNCNMRCQTEPIMQCNMRRQKEPIMQCNMRRHKEPIMQCNMKTSLYYDLVNKMGSMSKK